MQCGRSRTSRDNSRFVFAMQPFACQNFKDFPILPVYFDQMAKKSLDSLEIGFDSEYLNIYEFCCTVTFCAMDQYCIYSDKPKKDLA